MLYMQDIIVIIIKNESWEKLSGFHVQVSIHVIEVITFHWMVSSSMPD